MKKNIKKLSILSILSIMIFSGGYSYSSAASFNYSNKFNSSINSAESKELTKEELAEIDKEFREIFPEEMAKLEALGKSRANKNKTEKQLLKESQSMNPIIDVEKTVGDDYYRLVGYSNSVYNRWGIKDGSSKTGSGYVSYKDRVAYAHHQSAAVNALSGHTFSTRISYTLAKGGYDSIQSSQIGPMQLAVKNFYRYHLKSKETSSGSAYVKWRYTGRNEFNGNTGEYMMTVFVGQDRVYVRGDWIG